MKVYTGSQLLTMYRQMQSTLAFFNAKMLGTDNSVLREIVDIYREYTSILEGDQEVWNIYWTYKRRMWLPLDTVMHIVPDHTAELAERRRRRREAQVTATQRLRENLCVYDYVPRRFKEKTVQNCTQFMLFKVQNHIRGRQLPVPPFDEGAVGIEE